VAALGVGVSFAGFAIAVWGYCLVKGYNVPFSALWKTTWPGTQVAQTAPTAGHQLGTITSHAVVTNPAQIASQLGQ
jgi:hypothetical protein